MTHYFATDGNYGDATDILIVHTDQFTEADWEQIEQAPDAHRAMVAEMIAQRYSAPQRLLGL